jgi:hypothetical protein
MAQGKVLPDSFKKGAATAGLCPTRMPGIGPGVTLW